jgi:hypothetical protein
MQVHCAFAESSSDLGTVLVGRMVRMFPRREWAATSMVKLLDLGRQ